MTGCDLGNIRGSDDQLREHTDGGAHVYLHGSEGKCRTRDAGRSALQRLLQPAGKGWCSPLRESPLHQQAAPGWASAIESPTHERQLRREEVCRGERSSSASVPSSPLQRETRPQHVRARRASLSGREEPTQHRRHTLSPGPLIVGAAGDPLVVELIALSPALLDQLFG